MEKCLQSKYLQGNCRPTTVGRGNSAAVAHWVPQPDRNGGGRCCSNIANIDLRSDWGWTFDGEPFILHQDASVIIFGTDRNLHVGYRLIIEASCINFQCLY